MEVHRTRTFIVPTDFAFAAFVLNSLQLVPAKKLGLVFSPTIPTLGISTRREVCRSLFTAFSAFALLEGFQTKLDKPIPDRRLAYT